LGVAYLGGWDTFWNLLPVEWKLPLANYNSPPDFNFVGIFWQDGVAGSIGFLFMNMGLIMRFMATKSVDEGRKAAAFNVLFMLPISAVVVGNAGWIGKAISLVQPDVVPVNTSPDQIFVVVANIVSSPGVFGFIMASLTAALMSTVDTLINATAAIYINDIHRPLEKFFKRDKIEQKLKDKKELIAARYSSAIITGLGVLAVLAFKSFPTVYEAHGFFHSTLTPPLVVAIFLGIFWKRYTPGAVIATFIAGTALMILGADNPSVLIAPFDHGIKMNPAHPYSYIRALYNTFVCAAVGVLITFSEGGVKNIADKIKTKPNGKMIAYVLSGAAVILFLLVSSSIFPVWILFIFAVILAYVVSIVSNYFIVYDAYDNTEGLTIWSVAKAKEMFKGSKLNEEEGEKIKVAWELKDGEDGTINFSKNDMDRMKANIGDLVYISDHRAWLGGLKSIHSVYGEPHNEEGKVLISNEDKLNGQFIEGQFLTAEKEM
jgi:SSS family solute:Na+ symporter